MKMHSGRMHFYYGCTGTKTDGTIACAQQASAEGADAAVVIGAEGVGKGDTHLLLSFAEERGYLTSKIYPSTCTVS